jgi:ADP-ribose pyrophosphatase YjhB (NUDIX family)
MPKHIEAIARAVIIEAGHVLVCQHARKGYCFLPGGHIEFGESAPEALARELVEEAGVRIDVGELIAIEDHAFRQGGKRRHEFNFIFRAEFVRRSSKKGKSAVPSIPRAVRSREPGLLFVWCPLDKLRQLDLLPASHGPIIRAALRKRGAAKYAIARP